MQVNDPVGRRQFNTLMSYNNRRVGRLLTVVLALTVAATAAMAQGCNVVEPDSLLINWTAPCQDGSWLLDPQTGCRLWDWHPDPEDTVTWSGACPRGLKEGAGIVQWFEHGRPIDRFEGVFEHGKRKGFGRYYWPAGQRFEGYYDDDLPNGQGTITIDGVSYAGIWRRGCLAHKDKLIAIGAPLSTCTGGHSGKIAEKMGVTSGRPPPTELLPPLILVALQPTTRALDDAFFLWAVRRRTV